MEGRGRAVDYIRLDRYIVNMKNEAKIFKALTDETRLRILGLLFEGELCVCEIIAALELPQSTISRHLAYLRNSGWVTDRRQGVWMYYRLNQHENPLMKELRPVLGNRLTNSPVHAADREKLRHFQKEQERATC